ncbi:MAG: PilW family protein [Desulfuromonadales bacterium]
MRCEKTMKTACRGMTLVELLVVMGIFSVVMMAVMSLFIPAQRSTVVQSQVTDVQANLRLALNRLSHDLLTAGFLVNGEPIIFENGTDNPTDFTIQTCLVGSGFGRVASSVAPSTAGAEVKLNLTSADMAEEFPIGSLVRLISPVSETETDIEDASTTESTRVYEVVAVSVNNNGTAGYPSDDFAVVELDDAAGHLTVSDVVEEDILVRVADATQPLVQTIRYRFDDGNGDGVPDALTRTVNGSIYYLARNLSAVNFVYTPASPDRIQQVDIALTGQTRELVAGDAIAGAKTRALQTSVKLRNVF